MLSFFLLWFNFRAINFSQNFEHKDIISKQQVSVSAAFKEQREMKIQVTTGNLDIQMTGRNMLAWVFRIWGVRHVRMVRER